MMKYVLRFLTFFCMFTALPGATAYFIWQSFEPFKTALTHNYAELPLFLWLLIGIGFLSLWVTLWTMTITQQRNSFYMRALTALATDEKLNLKPFSKKQQQQLQLIQERLITQKKSLQRIINDEAKAKEAYVAEQIIQERQRLARDLHDSVSQQLFAASMMLSAINENRDLQQQTAAQLHQTEKIVQQAQLEMRALLLHLRPAALKNKTLAEGMRDLLIELRQKVTFPIEEHLEEVTLPKGAEDHLFRIAQETLSNTLRHSKATEVELLLVERDNRVIFRVQDNGVGFNIHDNDFSGSYGLRNIEERAIEIGGTYKIVSVPEQGTKIEVQIPTEQEETK